MLIWQKADFEDFAEKRPKTDVVIFSQMKKKRKKLATFAKN